MRNITEINADLVKAERMLEIAKKQNAPEMVMKQAEAKIEKIKNELAEYEAKSAIAVEAAKEDIKKSHGGAGRGQGRKPKLDKVVKPKGKRGGTRLGAGRKGSSLTKMVKPAGYKPKDNAPVFVKRTIVKKAKKADDKKSSKEIVKTKSVRAFGQKVEYTNDSDFCSSLIKAFKKRKAVSKKLGKKKTKPIFGIITAKVADAVSKAIDNTSKQEIEKNPKAFLAKATRLEKSAIRFLEDFKAILGGDFKKSEINAEFGELEKSIKAMVAKYK